jgi:hypothetical protein
MDARKNIIFQLVNTEWNQDYLSRLPHHSFMDLSIIYSYLSDDIPLQADIITNESPGLNQISKYELFDLAFVNTRRLLSPVVMPMLEILKNFEVTGSASLCSEFNNLLVISNQHGFFGAASIMYKDVLYEISCKLKSDFYILPSSVHECLITPVYLFDNPYELMEVVKAVNKESVKLTERLSNHVYYYDRSTRVITVSTS